MKGSFLSILRWSECGARARSLLGPVKRDISRHASTSCDLDFVPGLDTTEGDRSACQGSDRRRVGPSTRVSKGVHDPGVGPPAAVGERTAPLAPRRAASFYAARPGGCCHASG